MEIELKQTCSECPEQYSAFMGAEKVGYLRLRHGYFRVDYPDCGDETIYSAEPCGEGSFEKAERVAFLDFAKKAIARKLLEDKKIDFSSYINLIEQKVNIDKFINELNAKYITCKYACNGTETFIATYAKESGCGYRRTGSETLLEEDLNNYILLNLVEIHNL